MLTHSGSFLDKTAARSHGHPKNCKVSKILVAQWLTNLTGNHEVAGLVPGLAQRIGDLVLPRAVG